MTRGPFILLLLLLLLCCGGCKSDTPEEAYNRLVFNARMGNEEAFIGAFTEKSQRLIRTLLALRRAYGDMVETDADPYLSLVLEEVTDVEIEDREMKEFNDEGESVTVERAVATLTVTDGNIERKLLMIETEEGWRIDALMLQSLWSDDRKNFRTRM
jgi:hypothetical protein